jgi:hypothetical protein
VAALQIRVTWVDRSTLEDGFIVEYSTDDVGYTPILPNAAFAATIPSYTRGSTGQVYSYVTPALMTATAYRFRVRAIDTASGLVSPPSWPSAGRCQTGSPTGGAQGCVKGQVNLQGRTDHGGALVSLDGAVTTSTQRDGWFQICADAPQAAQHHLTVGHPHYLSRWASVMLAPSAVETLPFQALAGGDTNDDGAIDLFDLVRVGASFGTLPVTDPAADCNGDGQVNLFDLVLVGANYGLRGPIEWEGDFGSRTPDGRDSEAMAAPAAAGAKPADANGAELPAALSVTAVDASHIRVDVVAHAMPAVYGAELSLVFDPEVLLGVDESPRSGTQASPGSAWGGDGEYFVARNDIDNSAGRVTFAASRMAPAAPMQGDLTLLSVTFEVLQPAADGAARLDSVLMMDVTRKVETRWEGTDIYPAGSATWTGELYLPWVLGRTTGH